VKQGDNDKKGSGVQMVPVGQVYRFPNKNWGRKGVTLHPKSNAVLTLSPSGLTLCPTGKTGVTLQPTGVTVQPAGLTLRSAGLTITQSGSSGLTIAPR
jgi:hypothetical protein